MKISPIVASQPQAVVNHDEGRSAGAERIARAKAVLSGGTTNVVPKDDPATDPQVKKATSDIRKIKMRTQATPLNVTPAQEPEVNTESNISDTSESNPSGSEATKPLDPQLAAIAKEKRALQVKEREILAREQALASKETGTKPSADDLIARLKTSPLSVLQEHGVTYDKLTEDLLNDTGNNAEIASLKNEIKALKEGLENQNKSLSDRDARAEQQALNQMRRDAEKIVAQNDTYEMIRATEAMDEVVKLIERVWNEKQEILDVTEALDLVETDLVEQSLKLAQTKKIQSKLAPAQQQQQAGGKPMRTLTSRDGTSVPMTAKERAIAAFQGRLNR